MQATSSNVNTRAIEKMLAGLFLAYNLNLKKDDKKKNSKNNKTIRFEKNFFVEMSFHNRVMHFHVKTINLPNTNIYIFTNIFVC